MVQLHDNPFHADSMASPITMSAYKRRQYWKIFIRVSLIGILASLCFLIGRKVQWQSLTEMYGFDPREVDIIQYFCNHPSNIASDNIYDEINNKKMLEHVKAGYLKHEIAPDVSIPNDVWDDLPVKGAYYMVVRNEDLGDVRGVIKSMEEHMVNGTRYPWVLLNNQHFTKEFRTNVQRVTKAPMFFGKIDLNVWEYPHWIDVPRAEYLMMRQEMNNVHKGVSLSYHQMLRYHSGFFFHHPLLRNVDYTWRVEAGADYSCEMNDDKFLAMKEENKKLGFVLTMRETPAAIPTLWERVLEFMERYPEYVLSEDETILPWIYDAEEDDYNLCHFWSNFQIVDLSFFRSEGYQKYFEYLDNTGNFFYERWGDAPVQTIAAALFLKKEEIKFFNEIGYSHSVATHCPYNETLLRKCSCDVASNYDFYRDSCTKDLLKFIDPKTVKSMAEFVKKKKIPIPKLL